MIGAAASPSAQAPRTAPDEAPARRALHAQIERLERDLARTVAAGWQRDGLTAGHGGRSDRPRLRDLGELEAIRDGLAARVAGARAELRDRRAREADRLALVAEMVAAPERHRWRRVSHADVGRPGCREWRVVPRWGPVGLLADWWRVKVSSGCPLAT
ncbi:MAG: hypothetical protein GXY03_01775 [Solirubrobacterales bacterium]|nr:hypothetical protein [Solirubrobacterales bacterium]